MNTLNAALQAYFLYLNSKSIKGMAKGVKHSITNEKERVSIESEMRDNKAKRLSEQWDLYRTGNIRESKTQQLRSAAGSMFSGATAFQQSMSTNYMLATLPRVIASTVSGGASMLRNLGIQNSLIDTIGSKAANISSSLAPVSNMFRYAQYVNPMYAMTDIAMNKLLGAVGSAVGNPLIASTLYGPLSMLALPMIQKFSSKIMGMLAGGSISKKHISKLKPISVEAKLHSADEFINERPIQDANSLINQLYSLDPDQSSIDPIQNAQLQYLAEIAAYTGSIPILTSEIINNFIKKDTTPAHTYNSNLQKLEKFYKGKTYKEVIEKHADRMEHGKFAHTFTENIGLAATEISSFLNKYSVLLSPLKQIQMVLSGKNIKDEINKFDKAFQTTEQRKSAIFAKKMGIGDEESYAHMYFSLTEDSQSVLSRAKTFEDAQIGLLSGIYEFTRLTALETATLRTKAFGIKEPVKYNVIGDTDSQAKGVLNWLSNKIPMFEFMRTIGSGALNLFRLATDKLIPDIGGVGSIKNAIQSIIGKPRIYRYHSEVYNKMAGGFDLRRDSTLFERLIEPFADKFNKTLLNIPILKLFANENRLSLEQRKKLEYQEEMAKETKAIMKEMGLEKLEDQQLYYRYATTSMPEQFDLMIHHLSNIAIFTHAIMLNTAALSRIIAGGVHIEKPNEKITRSLNRYTGRLETKEESEEFMKTVMNAVVKKAKENAFENKKSWARALDTIKYSLGLGSHDADDEKDLIKGVKESFKHIFERERNTAEESWSYISEMTHRTLFSRDFLNRLDNPEYANEVLESGIDEDKLLQSRHSYGLPEFTRSQLPELEARMMRVDVAKISAPELLKFINYNAETVLVQQEISKISSPKTVADKSIIHDVLKNTAIENTVARNLTTENLIIKNIITENITADNTTTKSITTENTTILNTISSASNSENDNIYDVPESDIEIVAEPEKQKKATVKIINITRIITSKILDKIATGLAATELPEKFIAKFTKLTRTTTSSLLKKAADKIKTTELFQNEEAKSAISEILDKTATKIAATEAPENFAAKFTKKARITASALLEKVADKIALTLALKKTVAEAAAVKTPDKTEFKEPVTSATSVPKKAVTEVAAVKTPDKTEFKEPVTATTSAPKKAVAEVAAVKTPDKTEFKEPVTATTSAPKKAVAEVAAVKTPDKTEFKEPVTATTSAPKKAVAKVADVKTPDKTEFKEPVTATTSAPKKAVAEVAAVKVLDRAETKEPVNLITSAPKKAVAEVAAVKVLDRAETKEPVNLITSAPKKAVAEVAAVKVLDRAETKEPVNLITSAPKKAVAEVAAVKTPSKANISADNTIEGSKKAHENEILDLEEKQTEKLSSIEKHMNEVKKVLTIQQFVAIKNKKSIDVGEDNEESGSIFDLFDLFDSGSGRGGRRGGKIKKIGRLLGKSIGKLARGGLRVGGALKTAGSVIGRLGGSLLGKIGASALTGLKGAALGLVTNPVELTVAATAAAASAAAYGAYSASYGREKALINELEQHGIVEHNYFGNSRILRWDVVQKLPLEQLTQLLAFDDWDNEDKKALQNLVSQKTKEKTTSDTQRKNVFKNQIEFNKFINERDKEMREKQGFFGYWIGKGTQAVRHAVDSVFIIGRLLGLGNSNDRSLYNKLEKAGVIEYSTLPFIESRVRDWDTITKLNTVQLKSLLKLNWDDNTEKQLKEVLAIREKQKPVKQTTFVDKTHSIMDSVSDTVSNMAKSVYNFFTGDNENSAIREKQKSVKQTTFVDKTHSIMDSVSDTVSNMAKNVYNFFAGDDENSVLDKLSSKGILTKTPQGIKISNWDEIYELSADSIKTLMQYAGFADDSIKQKLQSIYSFKTGKQVADTRNSKNVPNLMKSKVDTDTVASTPTAQDPESNYFSELFETLIAKLDQLTAVTAAGYAKQVEATLQTAKNFVSEKIDDIKHPIIDS